MDNVSVFSNKYNKKKKKRKRTVISPEETERLESVFVKDPRPDRLTKMSIATELGKAEHVVSTWFQNRRARERRVGGTSSILEEPPEVDAQPLNLSLKDKTTRPKTRSSNSENTSIGSSQKCVRPALFGRLVRMAAAAEGGILSMDCPNIGEAMMDACNGIMLKDSRLVYHSTYGFDIETFTD